VYFASAQLEVAIVECVDAGERFFDPLHAHEVGWRRCA